MVKIFISFFLILFSINSFATHNRAGEILYKQISDRTYEFTVIMYTKSGVVGNSPTVTIRYGDGTFETTPRINNGSLGDGVPIGNGLNINIYKSTHTFSGSGKFIISIEDQNRTGGVINVPGSSQIPFYVETVLNISASLGFNETPVLQNPPIDKGCTGKIYTHNPGAWDSAGDSLSYSIVESKGAHGQSIEGYTFPTSSKLFKINSKTGDFVWESPLQEGEYNFAIKIDEWRKIGAETALVGSLTRDMQVSIEKCDNNPPVIKVINKLCVSAGDTINFPVTAKDPDTGDIISLNSKGGAFELLGKDAFFPDSVIGMDSVKATLTWITECLHIRKEPYLFTYRAIDNDEKNPLADMKSTEVYIFAPAPEGLTAIVAGTTASLSWNKSKCNLANGYEIYRRIDSTAIFVDSCTVGAPDGFIKVGSTNGISSTNFQDTGLKLGYNYCFLVIATYPDGAKSKSSEQVCIQLKRDVPIITHVSVSKTDKVNGSIKIQWAKPNELDTIKFPKPYKYILYRSINNASFTEINSFTSINDTLFTDTLINTSSNLNSYKIEFFSGILSIGSTEKAEEINLKITPSDNQLTLNWSTTVPWKNGSYIIYKKNNSTLLFDSIGITSNLTFIDTELANLSVYCYKIKSIGSYSVDKIVNPLINFSKEVCESPIDNIIPCPPKITVIPNCDKNENYLTWNSPSKDCMNDIINYTIYFKPSFSGTYSAIQEKHPDTTFLNLRFTSIAGCYVVTSIDSVGNESDFSNEFCVDNCPIYELPNVFSPENKDGINDVFVPFPYKYIDSIEIKIFNRWGVLVFTSTDPNINWDGTDMENKKQLSEGIYFYTITIKEIRLTGIVSQKKSGYIQLIR